MAGAQKRPPADGLGAILYARRMREGWSAEQAAAHFGISQSSYSRWESGINRPSGEQLATIARWLGLDVAEVNRLRYQLPQADGLTVSELHVQLSDLRRDYEGLVGRLARAEDALAINNRLLRDLLARLGVEAPSTPPPGGEPRRPLRRSGQPAR